MVKKEDALGLGKCKYCDSIAEWRDIQIDEIVNVCAKHVKVALK